MVRKAPSSSSHPRFAGRGRARKVAPGTPPDAAPHITSWLRLREDSAMPIYQQLEEQLTLAVQDGRLKPGTTLPAERYLAEILGISRTTVQRCYNGLRERNLVTGHGRLGT